MENLLRDLFSVSVLGLGFGLKKGWETGFRENLGWEMGLRTPPPSKNYQ